MNGKNIKNYVFSSILGLAIFSLLQNVYAKEGQLASLAQLKSLFIHKFINYIEWPPGGNTKEMSILVIDDELLFNEMSKLANTKKSTQYSIKIEKNNNHLSKNLKIIFISKAEQANKLLPKVVKMPILTITEGNDDKAAKGIIHFFILNKKLRFEINNDLAISANIEINSRLLNLSQKMGEQ